jgi:hypothetical protein
MTTIIAGGFTTSDAAERAMQHLIAAGVNEDNLCSFRVNPPGEHDGLAIGGDRSESPGATQAGGAGVGAYTGALVGALGSMDSATHRDEMRPAENLVAVNVDAGDITAERAISLFEDCGATQIERAEGTWSHGEWSDFDPIAAPHLIRATSAPPAPPG